VAAKSHDDAIKQKILDLSNAIAERDDCDIILFNFGLDGGIQDHFYRFLCKRKAKRKNILLFLTTEGGVAECAYRIAR
jgi:hypothetical protein